MLVAENELKRLKVKDRMTVLHPFFLPVYHAFAVSLPLAQGCGLKGNRTEYASRTLWTGMQSQRFSTRFPVVC